MKSQRNLLSEFRSLQNNPYAFSRNEFEYEHEVNKREKKKAYKLTPQEREVVREQHLTIFENDELMQKIFNADFEEYFKAVEDPELMEKKYEEHIRNLYADRNTPAIETGSLDDDEYWDELGDFDEFEMGMEEDSEYIPSRKKNELYDKSFDWSVGLHKICHKIYEKKQDFHDSDLFRVMINSTMVSAKVAYASDDDSFFADMPEMQEFDAFEYELNLKAYTLASTFLQRTRESLRKLIEKKFGPVAEWGRYLKLADELYVEIQAKMVELAKKLRSQ